MPLKNIICRYIYNVVAFINYCMFTTFYFVWWFMGLFVIFEDLGYYKVIVTGDLIHMADLFVIFTYIFVCSFVFPDIIVGWKEMKTYNKERVKK